MISVASILTACENRSEEWDVVDFGNDCAVGLQEHLECRFIPLETKDSVLLKDLYRVCWVDDRIFVFDRSDEINALFVFSDQGNFITRVGLRGQGPKEYLPLRRLRARGHRRVPQPHPPGNREIPLHLRRRPFETAGRGNLHRRPGKSGNGPQLQIFHGESAVTLRDDRILHRPSGADRERHARQMLRRIFERMHRQREEYHLPEPGTRRSDRDHCRR